MQDKEKLLETIQQREIQLNILAERNARHEQLQAEYDSACAKYNKVDDFYKSLGYAQVAIDGEAARYKESRLNFLNDVITGALLQIFPKEGYRANVVIDRKRGKESVYLELIDKDGRVSTPAIGQGMLMQYVISYAAISSVNSALGGNSLFIDEAFGVAAVDRLQELGSLIESRSQDQLVVLVAQNPALYEHLHVHKIVLEKLYNGETHVVEEIDE